MDEGRAAYRDRTVYWLDVGLLNQDFLCLRSSSGRSVACNSAMTAGIGRRWTHIFAQRLELVLLQVVTRFDLLNPTVQVHTLRETYTES